MVDGKNIIDAIWANISPLNKLKGEHVYSTDLPCVSKPSFTHM